MKCEANATIPCLLASSHWGVRSILMHVLKPFEITYEQWEIMHALYEQELMTQSDLAKNIDKEQASITRMVDKLEQREWVTRQSRSRDRRIKELQLTTLGKKSHEETLILIEPLQEELYSFFSPQEQEQLITLLIRVNTVCQQKLETFEKGES